MRRHITTIILLLIVIVTSAMTYAVYAPDDKEKTKKDAAAAPSGSEEVAPKKETREARRRKTALDRFREKQAKLKLQQDTIPDSLLHPRWKIQKTTPVTYDDLKIGAADLRRPEGLEQKAEYNDTLDKYVIGNKIGKTWVATPIMMDVPEYTKWSEKQLFRDYFRKKNSDIAETKGKEKFDFTDMHFDLGPAEKIFGPGGIRVKTQGTAELKLGATLKNIDNPSLPISNRSTTTVDFDMKINLNLTASVGDKLKMNLNYNTDATFDYDAQNMKLKYDGKEDDIIKLVEAGNVSFPSNSSLIQGASSLFGVRADMQFGKLKLQTVVSQKKSSTSSVSSRGGVQLTPFEINVANYEENRHFYLAHFFHDNYDQWMRSMPNIASGVKMNRVEIWVTNKNGQTNNTRDILAFPDLGEGGPGVPPSNNAGGMYSQLTTQYAAARDINQSSTVLSAFNFGTDYDKIEKARLLNASEYTVNTALGYVSLKSTVQPDQVVAIAYEYTYGGMTYQVGEFTSDITDVNQALFVKSLKNTSNNPSQSNWRLTMRNVYYLASSVQKEKFRLDVKYQSDSVGVYVNYIPEPQTKSTPLIKLMGADRLDNNNKAHSNGYFDFVEGYTVTNGRVFFPTAEPFGQGMRVALASKGITGAAADKYIYSELYDSTKTVAKQIAEKNRYMLVGQFKGTSANVISLGAYDVPQGSVVVTAGGVTLTEGSDYTVDYSAGEVTIINQSIIDAGTPVNVSCESQSDYSMERKTMFGINWEYDFSKDLQLSGTIQHLSEQTLTSKVVMGTEPVNNTLLGFNVNWKKESQWLTNMLDKIPFLHLRQPSNIQFNAEFAKLFSSIASGTQDNASYIDDFESATNGIDVLTPTAWTISSVPQYMGESNNKMDLSSGYHRARLAWYTIDPLFTRRSSTLTPSHIKDDADQLSNHLVREVYVNELYPNRDQSSYNGATSTLPILNLAYYPQERGPYNFNTEMDANGRLLNPKKSWGGMMRKLDVSDFEEANVEYIEFWMLDPFIYSRRDGTASQYTGKMCINLGEVSEDILLDGKKFYESGMPVVDTDSTAVTQWGRIPVQNTINYAFATTSGARAKQDVGFNGLNDEQERNWEAYKPFLTAVQQKVTNQEVLDSIMKDPAGDNYQYFRGNELDNRRMSILDRYKYINNPQGNSPDSENRTENYDTSYKTAPDVEDINQDFTLNEYEKYYEYEIPIDPNEMNVGTGYIVDRRDATVALRNGTTETVTWYQYRVPIKPNSSSQVKGTSLDKSSIRFMRIVMKEFEKPIVIRLASLDLVRGDWRIYEQPIRGASNTGSVQFTPSTVSIEENNERTPVNYVLPPGISRVVDPSQPQLTENNEQALCLQMHKMAPKDAIAVYKNTHYDMRYYNKLQMFVHANATELNPSRLQNQQIAVFVRLGSDYNNNYYEYEIPLHLTPAGKYNTYTLADCQAVWPAENMLNIDLKKFTALKKLRNSEKNRNNASLNALFSRPDESNQKNTISIVGNPSLGDVKTIMIGVKNVSSEEKDAEVWINELRLLEPESSGGWAAAANLNVQLSDLGTLAASGKYISDGFGGLEQKVMERTTDRYGTYSVTTNVELGKFFPEKAKVSIPVYYSITREQKKPKYNPLDSDMLLDDALETAANDHERDSIKSIAITNTVNQNFSISGLRVGIATKRHPMPYDPANFTLSYSNTYRHTEGETTVYENEKQWRGALNYSWTPVYKSWEAFKFIKSKSKYYDILKKFALNWLPQNVAFNTEMSHSYYELQERDLEDLSNEASLPVSFNSQFLWNRDFSIRWDITKNLHLSFQSATRAEIEQPYTPINADLYPDRYQAWKDSVWTSIRHMGTPLDYNQSFSASYQLPINLIPIFDWVTANGTYNSSYQWARGTEREDGTSYGNTINNNRTINVNGTFNMEKLYNHVPFLKKVNEKFNKASSKKQNNKSKSNVKDKKTADKDKGKDGEQSGDSADKQKKNAANDKAKAAELAREKNTYKKDITIAADTSIVVTHGKKSRRLIVSAKDGNGKAMEVKFKAIDDNKIKVFNTTDTILNMKLSVLPKQPLENLTWYKVAQSAARVLMMVRNVGITYRNQSSMALPGFMPNVGNVFGQRTGGAMAPGLDFAFGFVGEGYIDKARRNGWLMSNDSLATPATVNKTEDVQVKLTLEPFRNFKIDMNMSHTQTKAKSIQYMYAGNPTTQSGSFSMTTISIKSAFEGIGSADNGFRSASFEGFCKSLESYRLRVQSQFTNTRYPAGSPLAGKKFDGNATPVNKYSADVMVPAFLNAYTGYGDLSIFPAIMRMLPNWTIRYSGLSQLPWIRDHFKSVNLNHSYKSIYAVGAYNSYSTYQEFMGERIGFISDAKSNMPVPNSMFNVSTVSINEAFSPLLGLDFTLPNNLTFKAEYRTTRVLSLSMSSVQINETLSKDWVFGMGYKIADFRPFKRTVLKSTGRKGKSGNGKNDDDNNNRNNMSEKTSRNSKDFAHDLNLRMDLSLRDQAAITRDIASMSSSATSGNSAFKLSFTADYSVSRLLTMSFYYDRQSNTPLLSSGSYPTVTQDFGLSIKFSLTR